MQTPISRRLPQHLAARRVLAGALLTLLAYAVLPSRADIAVLREKGPHSGSAFSNPGLIADAPADLKVAMKTADVKIHLRPGDGDTLKADVTAEFELEDSSPAELAGQLYLVGFPVTGLSSKIVTIDNFAVTVDGEPPATVLRQAITISRREAKLSDSPVSGKLDARFALKHSDSEWEVNYAGDNAYRASYVWQQAAHPGASLHVQVWYTVTLHPQSIHYSKSYDDDESDWDVIPSKSLKGDRWNDQFYFFDYVLRSGATWDGVIGQEVVEVTSDPKLGLAADNVILQRRKPTRALNDDGTELPELESPPHGVPGKVGQSVDTKRGTIRWMLENGDPSEDLLIAIPLSAIKRAK